MLANLFESHGQFCARHPWEMIVAVLTLTACLLSLDNSSGHSTNTARVEETNALDIIFMTIVRSTAVLYSYYQFRKLRKLGSNYILGIAGLFTVFSSFVFSSTVVNILRTDVSDLKDALFFFVLVLDLSKASVLAQFALRSSNQKEVNQNIARGMALLGPTITLDTLVGTLVISVGTLSGVERLETLCCFVCFSFIVNYFVFMTFYPACLSLILELSRSGSHEKGTCLEMKSPLVEFLYDEGHKPNPVVQRVKVIMSAGMMIVHAHSRWSLNNMENGDPSKLFQGISGISSHNIGRNDTDANDIQSYLMRFLTMSTDHIVILILILALTVKYVFFDDKEELTDQVLQNGQLNGRLNSSNLIYVRKLQHIGEKSIQTESTEKQTVSTFSQTSILFSIPVYPKSERESTITQIDSSYLDYEPEKEGDTPPRAIEECCAIYKKEGSAEKLTDREICNLVKANSIRSHQLENVVEKPVRGVGIRRMLVGEKGGFRNSLQNLPYLNYDYTKVMGACCENVLGYIPIPLGITGPLLLDGRPYYVPMATTEGCLVASTNRGCRAISEAGGANSCVVFDGMSRGPVVRFPSIQMASNAMIWINNKENFELIKASFDSTSRFARLQDIHVRVAGRHLFIRFTATTGDAMGMNMTSKGTESALNFIKENFSDMEIISVSGNFCTDKKPAAINWIEGRGKSVVCGLTIPHYIVKNVLKTTTHAMVEVNLSKNMMGSAMAGSIGGFNAHAANIVTAIYIATGQDPAQNVCSSNCITYMEPVGDNGNDLYISCSMPSIEIGTVGGGTALPAQSSCLDILGVKGANENNPGDNAKTLASIVCGTVLAGELSLIAALSAGDLVKSHLTFNRASHAAKNDSRTETKSIILNEVPGRCLSS